jgi:hypothetical protein
VIVLFVFVNSCEGALFGPWPRCSIFAHSYKARFETSDSM